MKKALILDLDNTIYPVAAIGETLFRPLFDKLEATGRYTDKLNEIKKDVMRIPFQAVAEKYGLESELTDECISLLKTLEYKGPIKPFEDFDIVRRLPVDRFLVTTGFLKMQQSKVDALQLEKDFKRIYIIDPTTTHKTKKDQFAAIMEAYHYHSSEVLVIGDDLHSEIKGAAELGIATVFYNRNNEPSTSDATQVISHYQQLVLD